MYNYDGRLIRAFVTDNQQETVLEAPPALKQVFNHHFSILDQHGSLDQSVSGIIADDRDLYLVASRAR
jgi:hypothetical protein